MKYSIPVKFLAIVLCAVSLVTVAASTVSILFLESSGLYRDTLENRRFDKIDEIARSLAQYESDIYTARTESNCPQDILDRIYVCEYSQRLAGRYGVSIENGQEVVAPAKLPDQFDKNDGYSLVYTIYSEYPMISGAYVSDSTGNLIFEPNPDFSPAEYGEPIYSSSFWGTKWYNGDTHEVNYALNYYQSPGYQVTVTLPKHITFTTDLALMEVLYPHRNTFIVTLLVGALLAAVTLVYLCISAGHSDASDEIRPGGLNRLPLDFYAVCVVIGITLLSLPIVQMLDIWSYEQDPWDSVWIGLTIFGLCSSGISLLSIGLVFALAAQSKMGSGYWWRHSCIGWVLHKIYRGLCFVGHGMRATFLVFPVMWQWLLTMLAMILAICLSTIFCYSVYSDGWQMFWLMVLLISLVGSGAIVCYGAYSLGVLMKGTQKMAEGDLHHKIPTQYLFGTYKDFATQLNALGGATQAAVDQQLKSERMKTELITNVSHDIKTPLTSIINYVDLMQRPHSEADNGKYLEVLDRQSHQLKKLIEDLMDMSKASSGNMPVEMTEVDAAEMIKQALGEFSDKLERANLTPVFHHPDFPVMMQADGRLLCRIFSNLLTNAVKYALPGTRLYIDMSILQNNVVISMKNISKDQLNIDAEDLMERFVRGDASRNTEGSGLGLNIAKSLAELQHGKMLLVVDGDLFKVTLMFPLV